jgi:transcriptional regulator with XRE-family HTH domain
VKKSHNRRKTASRTAFGRIVRYRQENLGQTQEEAAEKASLHPTYWGSVKRGERNVSLENIIAMTRALGCSPKDLMPEA